MESKMDADLPNVGREERSNKTSQRRWEWFAKAGLLSEALPFMRFHSNQTFVVKYGGHAMGDPKLAKLFARDIVLLKQVGIHPIVVHGGGPQIGRMLERLGIKSRFVDGLRVTDRMTAEVVEMVLSGTVNKEIVADIISQGGAAVGVSGKDGPIVRARHLMRSDKLGMAGENISDTEMSLGFVGVPEHVDPRLLESLVAANFIPVVAPLGLGAAGETFNINADTVAGALAGALGASRLFLLTDVTGVLNSEGKLIQQMSVCEAYEAIANAVVTDGMIPKVETCIQAIGQGVQAAAILDGRVPHSMLLEVFTASGTGTLISAEGKIMQPPDMIG